MVEIRVRIAPSPTGIPHIGNTRTALFNWLFARANQGKFIVRIEDTDRERLVPESVDKILEILKWLGLEWDEGPVVGGPYGPYIQSERLNLYQEHARKLIEEDKAYYCFCSPQRLEEMRKKQEADGLPPKYDRRCLSISREEAQKRIDAGEKAVIRMKIPDKGKTSWPDLIHSTISFDNNLLDDSVLLKSDGFPTYHLGVVVDDHLMQISHILRGDEWISSTPKHIILYKAFNWEIPQIGHFPLVFGSDKAKLSKRHGAKSVLEYRDEGYLKEAILNFMLFLGWSPKGTEEILSLDEMIAQFSLQGVNPTNPIFNLEKLKWFNGKYLRQLSDEELLKRLQELGYRLTDTNYALKILPLIKDRMVTLRDFDELTNFFFEEPKPDIDLLLKNGKTRDEVKQILEAFKNKISSIEDWQKEKLEEISRGLVEKFNQKTGDLFMVIRIAITGKTATPPLFETMAALGKEKTLKRLEKVLNALK